jgi:hypothetical protein
VKKSALLLLAGAIFGPMLMGLFKIMVFAAGLAAIICCALFLMGGDDDE